MSMMAHSRGGFAALLGIAVSMQCLACARGAPEDSAPGAQGASKPLAPPQPPPLDTRTMGWELGRWYVYSLKLTTAVAFGDGANAFDFDVAGVVQITPTAVTPDTATLFVAVDKPSIVSRVPGSQPQFDKVAAQIASTGCFFSLAGGRVTEMRAPRGLSATAANTYREIVSGLQFARTVPVSDRYTAEEYDTTGQYVAEYEIDPDRALWHKRKQRYVAILAAKTALASTPARVVPQIDRSDGEVRLLADGRPQTLDLRNSVTVAGAQQPVHSTTSLSLQAGPSQPARQPALDWTSLMAAMQRTAADEPYGPEATIESLDSARIGGMTFDKAVAAFDELAKEKARVPQSSVNGATLDADEEARRERVADQESRLFIALSAIFRSQPETIPKALQRIKAKSPVSDVLIEALSAASSPATQDALVNLASSKSTAPGLHTDIVMALSRTPRPEAKSVDMLTGMLKTEPFNEMALLGLGTFARRLRDAGSVEQANAIGTLLLDRLGAAQTTTDRLTTLRAIANSGYAPALPRVTGFLTDSQDQIRVDALRALQSMRDPRVDDILAERMQMDSSNEVRMSALSAANVRDPTDVLARAVEQAASTAHDPHVRYRAVEVLAGWATRRPDVRPTLERIAKNDGEVRIRDRAQNAL